MMGHWTPEQRKEVAERDDISDLRSAEFGMTGKGGHPSELHKRGGPPLGARGPPGGKSGSGPPGGKPLGASLSLGGHKHGSMVAPVAESPWRLSSLLLIELPTALITLKP
jgi:hypothetical protein